MTDNKVKALEEFMKATGMLKENIILASLDENDKSFVALHSDLPTSLTLITTLIERVASESHMSAAELTSWMLEGFQNNFNSEIKL